MRFTRDLKAMELKKVFLNSLMVFLLVSQGAMAYAFYPKLSYDTQNNRFMVIHTKPGEYPRSQALYGQLRRGNGTAYGPEFLVFPGVSGIVAAVAHDPHHGRFLVVSSDCSARILGQLVDTQGTMLGESIVIFQGTNYMEIGALCVTYDTAYQWKAPAQPSAFRAKYSIDNGATWLTIADGFEDTREYDWQVPPPPKNQRNCLLKVAAFDSDGRNQASDRSDAPFTIEVVKLTDPNEGESFFSGDPFTITWTTYATERPVESVDLFLTRNGGVTWKLFDTFTGNPGTYVGTVPSVPVTKEYCKIKVILKEMDGIPVGHDASDLYFTIQPQP